MTSPCILALDTATEVCSVALLRDDACHTRREEVGQGHSGRILPMVDELLREHRTALQELDFIAFGAGPGSFTGLRIACGIAQGLAWGIGKRVIPVGNLQALAARALAEAPEASTVLCAIDARMHEAYCAVYRRGTVPIELRPPLLVPAAQLDEFASGIDAVAGNALTAFPDAWSGAPLRRLPTLRPDASDIVRLAAAPAGRAGAVEASAAAPLYVRDHVALTTAERRAQRTDAQRQGAT
jgi:tRNA threonylcarbamoyladenosine biosynthesis protein TsaB